jgi:hypothetical protein
VPRTCDPQLSETGSPAPRAASRRLALGVAALALAPIGLLTACGNAGVQQKDDTRPEPNASTEGVRSVYPTVPSTSQQPVEPLKTGEPSPGLTPAP